VSTVDFFSAPNSPASRDKEYHNKVLPTRSDSGIEEKKEGNDKRYMCLAGYRIGR